MLLSEKEILLKNGSLATLKTPDVADAAQMLAYIRQACAETDFLARYPEEWDSTTLEQEENWVKRLRASPDTLAIACFADGTVVGNCEINFRGGIKTAHRATVAIAVLRAYWNQGIGSAMFEEMLAAARTHGTEIVELEYVEGNRRAHRLYEKFGFSVVAEKPKSFKLKDGTYLSEISMQKYL